MKGKKNDEVGDKSDKKDLKRKHKRTRRWDGRQGKGKEEGEE